MCGRFTLTHREARALAAELGVSVDDLLGYRPRYNIAPTDDHWIVRTRYEDRQVLPAKWGLINFWMTDRKQAFKNINARAETVRRHRPSERRLPRAAALCPRTSSSSGPARRRTAGRSGFIVRTVG